MKKFFETFKNIFKIEELRKRIVYTLLLVLVYRLGCFVVIPGIDATMLASLQSSTQEGLVGLLNMFSGGAFGNASIFALGVMPYISASIVIQLLGMFVPYFKKLQMEGESGRRKMNQITRYLTIVILAIQCPAYLAAIHNQIPGNAFVAVTQLGWSNFAFNFVSTVVLLAGSMFVMWLGERITDRGIGNGISLIIMIGIVARLPYALAAEIGEKLTTTNGGLLLLIVELLVLFFVFIAAIALVQAVRKIPVQYAKRVVGNKQYGGVRDYLPLKNQCGRRHADHLRPGSHALPASFLELGCYKRTCCNTQQLYRILVQLYFWTSRRHLHIFLHCGNSSAEPYGRADEAERRIYTWCETWKEDHGVYRRHPVKSYSPWFHFPRFHCNYAGICDARRCQ